MTSKQQIAIKSFINDANNCLNGVFLSFDSLNEEFYLGKRLVDTFSNHFFFHKANQSFDESKTHHCNLLDNIILNVSSDLSIVVVVSNASIKNNITTSITHVYLFNSFLKKTLHHTINIIIMEAELFAIRYRINQTTQIPSVVATTCHLRTNDLTTSKALQWAIK